MTDYLPGWVLPVQRTATVVVVLLALAVPRLPVQRWWNRDLRGFISSALFAVILAGMLELLPCVIASRPQPVASTGALAFDDALRSTSVHVIAGAGLALLLWTLGGQLSRTATVVLVQLLRWTMPILAWACLIAAILSWAYLGNPSWWPSRRAMPATGAPPARP